MSPASYLTAPPRGVARIVAPSLRWSPCGIGHLWPSLVFWRRVAGIACTSRCLRAARWSAWRASPARHRRRCRRRRSSFRRRRPERSPRASRSPTTRRRAPAERRAPARLPRSARRPARGARRGTAPSDESPPTLPHSDRRRGRSRDEHHPASRRRCRGRPRRGAAPRDADHAPRRGVDARRRLLPVPIARVRNTLSDYRRSRVARRRANAARRDERRARRGERRGVPRRDRVELRVRDAAALGRRGGAS